MAAFVSSRNARPIRILNDANVKGCRFRADFAPPVADGEAVNLSLTVRREVPRATKREWLMNVITLASRKGGAGKSTLTAQLAAQCQLSGRRTLIIDADPQGSLSLWHSLRKDGLPKLA